MPVEIILSLIIAAVVGVAALVTGALGWLMKHYFKRMETRMDKGDEKFDVLAAGIMEAQSTRAVCRAEMEGRVVSVEKDTVDHVLVYHAKGSRADN